MTRVQIRGYADGMMNLTATFAQSSRSGTTLSYKNVEVIKGMLAVLGSDDNQHLLQIDINGDGSIDQYKVADNREEIWSNTSVYLPLIQD